VGLKFEKLVAASEAVRQTRSRQQKVEHLAACIAELGAEPAPENALLLPAPASDIPPAAQRTSLMIGVAYLAGELPQGRVGLGPAAVFANPPAAAREVGELSVLEVDRAFDEMARVSGAGSVRERLRLWSGLLERCTGPEQAYLRHLVVGELRQGALESLVADAVARAAKVSADSVRRALMLSGSLSVIAQAAMAGGEAALSLYHIELFRPLQPMLAQTAETPEEAIEALGRALFEHKLDGARVQVHKNDATVRVYTRQLSDVTAAVPEVVELVRALPSRSLVLDGEVLSLREDGAPEPFQVTMRRFGRKLDVARMRETQPLHPFFFDILHRDGGDLIDLGTSERLAELDAVVPPERRMPRLVSGDAEEAASFFEAALDRGHEGVMAKALDASYAAGRRGKAWLKLKSHHTFDLVVLAVEWGSGRRKGWLSNLHLGARDPKGGFVMVGKTFKGLTDALLEWQTRELGEREIARDAYTVYVRPELVVEIAFNDVQQSPHYPGGVALRFARVKRYRPDKSALEADTIDAVRALCAVQSAEAGSAPEPR
jgi:DNA ligase-1